MPLLEDLSESEAYLWSILQDESGIDLAELTWVDEERDDKCFRAWPFQYTWWRCKDKFQVDQCARSVGKSQGLVVRACVFPFIHPGQEYLITGPEGIHVDLVTDKIETRLKSVRLLESLLVGGRQGFKHKPFHANFINGSRIIGRIPHRDGAGIKGCATGDMVVLTREGLKSMMELKVGDEVWTHESRWRPVLYLQTFEDETFEVRGQGGWPVRVSDGHRFYGRINKYPQRKRTLKDPIWAGPLDDLSRFYWASPSLFPSSSAVPLPGFDDDPTFPLDKNFWWIAGRYAADGHTTRKNTTCEPRNRMHITVVRNRIGPIGLAVEALGLAWSFRDRKHSSAGDFEVCNKALATWLHVNIGNSADTKTIPPGLLFAPKELRGAFVDGYMSGDGTYEDDRDRWSSGSASKRLSLGIKLLVQSLGRGANCSGVQPPPNDLCENPLYSWRIDTSSRNRLLELDGNFYGKIHSCRPTGKKELLFNPIIEEDHSYMGDGVFHHNTHPIWLDIDEASDYPEAGWTEINETLKKGSAGAVWRCHGVTRGVHDTFFDITQPDSGWTVHRYAAQYRPTWDDDERQFAIRRYGSREDPDYKRNILGEHGDSMSHLFVLHRLLNIVDDMQESEYNQDEYRLIKIKDSMLTDDMDILQLVDLPLSHTSKYETFWAGMDLGYTVDPSEILIFAEDIPRGDELKTLKRLRKGVPGEGVSRLKLITRIQLMRIAAPQQAEVVKHLVQYYRPRAFALDKTGAGLPLFQFLEKDLETISTIKGYNFSEKLLVDFDASIETNEFMSQEEIAKEAGIKRNVIDYSTDVLRGLVDTKRLWLPWDKELIGQFQSTTYKLTKSSIDQYGKRYYSKGDDHILDAARMAALAWKQHSIEEFMKEDQREAVPVFFVDI